jgi:hypothetical protein
LFPPGTGWPISLFLYTIFLLGNGSVETQSLQQIHATME